MGSRSEAVATPYGSAHEGSPAVIARYRTLVDVRLAIESLESSGVDGDDLALIGDTAVLTEQTTNRRRSDSRVLSSVGAAIAIGIFGGAALGGLVGAILVGPAVLAWSSLASPGWVFGLMVAWFAAGGSLLGAFFAVERRIGFSESWPLTFEDDHGRPLWLAVYDGDEKVHGALQETRPLEIVPEPEIRTAHPDLLEVLAHD